MPEIRDADEVAAEFAKKWGFLSDGPLSKGVADLLRERDKEHAYIAGSGQTSTKDYEPTP